MEPVDFLPNWLAEILFWIYYSQTLITGIIALGVGWLTVRHLRRQFVDERIRHQDQLDADQRRHEDQRNRKLRALRAGLPIALSEIHEYATEAIELLSRFVTADGKLLGSDETDIETFAEIRDSLPPRPEYPSEAFKALQGVIEHADQADAEKLHEIIAYGQIHNSRFRSISARIIDGANPSMITMSTHLLSAIRDSLGMRLHVDRAFDYARETTGHIGDLPSAAEAADRLMWGGQGDDHVRRYVLEHWPPNFPRKSPKDDTLGEA